MVGRYMKYDLSPCENLGDSQLPDVRDRVTPWAVETLPLHARRDFVESWMWGRGGSIWWKTENFAMKNIPKV